MLYKYAKTYFMCNQIGGKHLASTRCTVLNKEWAEDKFHKFFTSIPSRLTRDEWDLHVRNDPLLIHFKEFRKQKKKKVRCNDIKAYSEGH